MKRVAALIIAVIFFCCANNAFCAGWAGSTKITLLIPQQANLQFLVEYSSPYSTCNLDVNGNGTRFALDPNDSDYKIQAAAITAAFFAHKTISFAFTEVTSCAPKVTTINVYP